MASKNTTLLTEEQRSKLVQLSDDVSDRLLARYHTFSEQDLGIIHARQRNSGIGGNNFRMKPAFYMRFLEGHSGRSVDRVGGLPTHLPERFPRFTTHSGEEREELAFVSLAPDGALHVRLQ